MDKKAPNLIKRYWSVISYIFFGGLTTVVNYAVYLPLYNLTDLPATLSNVIAWAVSVAFAYLTNKTFVFKSKDWTAGTVLPELGKFIGCRVLSGLVETLLILLMVDILAFNGNIWKLIVSVFVVIFNYFASKFFIFKEK
jgi:putative flippase GtrA